jgi:hypothetical protein
MLHGVRDVDFVAVDAGLFETLIQKLACGTDEGLAFDVFAVSGLFADEDQSGARFAFSKNGLRGACSYSGQPLQWAAAFRREFRSRRAGRNSAAECFGMERAFVETGMKTGMRLVAVPVARIRFSTPAPGCRGADAD